MPRKLSEKPYPIGRPSIQHMRFSAYTSLDITAFLTIVNSCLAKTNAAYKRTQIEKLLNNYNWKEHYKDKKTGRRVLSESAVLEYHHEKTIATFLARMNYDVIFAPEGMFKRNEKKFDVFLLRDTIVLKADLKNISSRNSDNIAKRIKEGSDQASRIVVNITSDIEKRKLIDALRSAALKNELLKEVLLIYKGQFYKLPKSLVLSKDIYNTIK